VALEDPRIHIYHHFVDEVALDAVEIAFEVVHELAKKSLDELGLHPWSEPWVKVPLLSDDFVAEFEAFNLGLMDIASQKRVQIVPLFALLNSEHPCIRLIELIVCVDVIVEVLVEGGGCPYHHNGIWDEADQLEEYRELDFCGGPAGVVAVADGWDDGADPVEGKDVELPLVHAVEIGVFDHPGLGAGGGETGA